MKFYDWIWLIPLFPLAGAIINGLFTHQRGLGKTVAHTVALVGSGLAWLWAWASVLQWYFTEDITKAYVVKAFTWITGGSCGCSTAPRRRWRSPPASSWIRCRR
jgi:NADH:ubiquinone oxidoreductase subunit 5 (subunit L)/multisubunit Na+/H+ antiporter MnhA subunit